MFGDVLRPQQKWSLVFHESFEGTFLSVLRWSKSHRYTSHSSSHLCGMQRCQEELVMNSSVFVPSWSCHLEQQDHSAWQDFKPLPELSVGYTWWLKKKNQQTTNQENPFGFAQECFAHSFPCACLWGILSRTRHSGSSKGITLFSQRTGNQNWDMCSQVLFYCLLNNWELICYPCKSPANYGLVVKWF